VGRVMWGSAPLIQAKTGEGSGDGLGEHGIHPHCKWKKIALVQPVLLSPHRRLGLSFSLKACDTSDAVLRLFNISRLSGHCRDYLKCRRL
jgi:hypothetical protein